MGIIKFIGYSIISAIIFMLVFTLWFTPHRITDKIDDIKDIVKNIQGKINENIQDFSEADIYCKENIIPENVTFAVKPFSFGYRLVDADSGWKDGTKIGVFRPAGKSGFLNPELAYKCRAGSEKGENVNYIYCANLEYSKTEIGETREIGETLTYKIDLILNRIEFHEVSQNLRVDILKIVDYKCYKV